jgi:hypothetical protein
MLNLHVTDLALTQWVCQACVRSEHIVYGPLSNLVLVQHCLQFSEEVLNVISQWLHWDDRNAIWLAKLHVSVSTTAVACIVEEYLMTFASKENFTILVLW